VFDGRRKAGGMMRTQIPKFRLPETVIDEEVGYILDLGVELPRRQRIDSLKALLAEGYDAVFVGCGAPRGRDLDIPGRKEAAANIHIGIDWLSSVSFGHITKIGKRVIVLGGGNTAMDCCRTSRRLGGEDVKVIVRSGFEEMKASPWEKEDAMHEGIPILNFLVPKAFTHDDGKLTGVTFEKVKAEYDAKGRRNLVPTGEPDVHFECDDVLVAVGQENAFPWIERDIGIEFDNGACRWSTRRPCSRPIRKCSSAATRRSARRTSSGRWRTATRPRSRSTSCCNGEDVSERAPAAPREPDVARRWASTSGATTTTSPTTCASRCRMRDKVKALLQTSRWRSSSASTSQLALQGSAALPELRRADGVRRAKLCIECDACVDICPMDCITFTANGEEAELRTRLKRRRST
jgi:formate dehydrogenase beta subunit